MWMHKITTGKKWELIVVIQYIAITSESAGKSSGYFEKLIVGRNKLIFSKNQVLQILYLTHRVYNETPY